VDGQARSETGLSEKGIGLSDGTVPTLVIIYPSHPLNWNAASVALTRDGNPVLALGPHGSAGLDIDQHARNYRAALQLWQEGQLTPLGRPGDDWAAMSGSFSSLIMFKALQDLPAMPPAIVAVGGVSDAFLGVQALYDADLAIPAPYDSAVAALGRPDRDPAFFYGFSPVFYADRLPPTFVIHTTNDEVIPANQAEALAAALDAAGVPHELLLYEDTTHYLDAYNPTPATHRVYERVLAYVQSLGK
jgi:acetyl esterase/lipase